ncbi:hypothetical protein IE53DRAFT_386992 [Violaceomyces palustris]|uniref:Uncharacterized protein n=1 Tax=Violaceomyces palustris TaxID=1673888 RepID=A0ACD0NY88_9BASI|nr:hypothetical protein IE53DRAFT_386992 [Violaceomyces palustris]
MVALALGRKAKGEPGSGQSSPLNEAPSLPSGASNAAIASRPNLSSDPEMIGKLPKRSSSFGKGLGLASLTSGMSRAGDVMHSFGRNRSGASTPVSAPNGATGNDYPFAIGGGHTAPVPSAPPMGPPLTPDPSHLSHFALRLSELVNKAFVPCCVGSIPPSKSTTEVAAGMAGAARSASGGGSAFSGIPRLQAICYEGKRLPERAKLIEIAQTVVGELQYAASVDHYLLRAVSRHVLKALTLFSSRIDSLLVSVSKDPSALKIPTTPKEGTHLPAAMEFNIGLVTLLWIVEDSLERCIEGERDARGELVVDGAGRIAEPMPHFVSEILTPVRKKMEGTILHVIQPILAQVKLSLTKCISTAVPTPFTSTTNLSPTVTPGVLGVLETVGASTGQAGATSTTSPGRSTESLVAPAGLNSVWLRDLEARLEAARRLLIPRIEERCGKDGEGWFISVAVHIIWKGLLILTSRNIALPAPSFSGPDSHHATPLSGIPPGAQHAIHEQHSRRSPSPAQLASALKSVGMGSASKPKKGETGSDSKPDSGRQTPAAVAPDSSLHNSAITTVSRKLAAHQIAELQAFEKLIVKFCDGFVKKPDPKGSKRDKGVKRGMIPFLSSASSHSHNSPTQTNESHDDLGDDEDEEDELARAALAEALHAIRCTITVLQALEKDPEAASLFLDFILAESAESPVSNLAPEVRKSFEAMPNLLILQILYNRLPLCLGRLELPSPPGVFGYTWAEYEKAIAGFAGGEVWAKALVARMKPELETAWISIESREAERIEAARKATPSEEVDSALGKAAAAAKDGRRSQLEQQLSRLPGQGEVSRDGQRKVSGTSLESTDLSQGSAGCSVTGEASDSESDVSGPFDEAMAQSAPTLERKKSHGSSKSGSHGGLLASSSLARASEPDLSSPMTVSRLMGMQASESDKAISSKDKQSAEGALRSQHELESVRGRNEGVKDGSTAPIPDAGTTESALPEESPKLTSHPRVQSSQSAAQVPPKFWRRSSSTARGAFHLSFPSLSRASSPKPRGRSVNGNDTTRSEAASAQVTVAASRPSKVGSSLLSSASTPQSEIAAPVHQEEDVERLVLLIRKESECERACIQTFAKAITYVSNGALEVELGQIKNVQTGTSPIPVAKDST